MKDVRGIELEIGQIVGVAERSGNVAVMRSGKIVALYSESNTVSVAWDTYPLFGPKVSNLSLTGQKVDRPRFIVVDSGL